MGIGGLRRTMAPPFGRGTVAYHTIAGVSAEKPDPKAMGLRFVASKIPSELTHMFGGTPEGTVHQV